MESDNTSISELSINEHVAEDYMAGFKEDLNRKSLNDDCVFPLLIRLM